MKPELKDTIEAIVRGQLGGDRVSCVDVVEDIDFDGDEVLRVTVVLQNTGSVDPVKATGLVRHMRSSLTENGRFTFPIVAFRSLAEQKRLKAAAA